MKLGVNKVKKVTQPEFKTKPNPVIKCQKSGFLDIFSETILDIFLIFCMIVEGNREHHLSIVSYVGKDNLGIKGYQIGVCGHFLKKR